MGYIEKQGEVQEAQPPEPPSPRYFCDVCGFIKNGKHTNLICRIMGVINELNRSR